MTVLVGILCTDGVVIGADSSATFAAGQMRTIEQPTQKIHIIDGQMIVAATGSVGLSQRLVEIIKQLRSNGKLKGEPVEIGKAISAAALIDFGSTMPHLASILMNRQLQFGALVASIHKSKPYLIEFDPCTFQSEFKDDRIWYVSMGSGQQIADPFLGLMRRVFFRGGLPDLPTGTFVVSWALEHTCDVNPGGIKEPFHIAILKEGKAAVLAQEDLQEHKEMVKLAYRHLSSFQEDAFQAPSPEIPG